MVLQHSSLPLVSVYVPTHNRVGSLKRAIDSIFAQSYKKIEICICDDGSKDSTYDFCMSLAKANENVKFRRNSVAQGACYARNVAISLASGQFITGLDDDDEFLPFRIEMFMDNWNGQYSFLCDNFINVRDDCHTKHYRRGGIFSLDSLKLNNEAGNQIFTLTDRVRNVGCFSVDLLKLQDWDLWLRLCEKYGNFLRLNHGSYRMNHGHMNRVSDNLSYSEALTTLMRKNNTLYADDDIYLIERYLVRRCCFPNVFAETKFAFDKGKREFILKKILRNSFGR